MTRKEGKAVITDIRVHILSQFLDDTQPIDQPLNQLVNHDCEEESGTAREKRKTK